MIFTSNIVVTVIDERILYVEQPPARVNEPIIAHVLHREIIDLNHQKNVIYNWLCIDIIKIFA